MDLWWDGWDSSTWYREHEIQGWLRAKNWVIQAKIVGAPLSKVDLPKCLCGKYTPYK